MTTGCEKLLQKVVSSFTFCRAICSLRLLPAQGKLWRNTRVEHDSCVILSNQKSVFTQWTQLEWRWVVKRGTLLKFHFFCILAKYLYWLVLARLGFVTELEWKLGRQFHMCWKLTKLHRNWTTNAVLFAWISAVSRSRKYPRETSEFG